MRQPRLVFLYQYVINPFRVALKGIEIAAQAGLLSPAFLFNPSLQQDS